MTPPDHAAYCEAPKALYAWSCTLERERDGESGWWHLLHDTECHDRLVELAAAHRVSRVHLYVGAVEWDWAGSFSQGTLPYAADLAALTTRLRSAGIEPWAMWYLNDDPDDLSNHERVEDLVRAVAEFSLAHPAGAFAGVHGDQEPNDPAAYAPYLAMTELGSAAAARSGLGFGASLKPAWLTIEVDGAPMTEAILARSSTGTLMDYTDRPELATERGVQFLTSADALGRRAEIAIETGSGDPTPGVSFAELVATDPDGFYTLIGQFDASFSRHPSYDGIAIHDFAQYFAGLHAGVGPYDFVGEVGGPCPEEPPVTTPTGDTGTAPTVPETEDEPDDEAPPAAPPASSGCGCAVDGPTGGAWVVALVAWWRRRAPIRTPSA